jgi:hypothetical protein
VQPQVFLAVSSGHVDGDADAGAREGGHHWCLCARRLALGWQPAGTTRTVPSRRARRLRSGAAEACLHCLGSFLSKLGDCAGAASRTGRLAQAPPLEPCGDGCVRTGLSLFRLQLARPGFDPRDDLLRKLRWHAPVAFRLGSELRCGLYPPQRHGFQEISARECVEAEQSQRHQVVHRNRPTARITGQTRLEGARARPPWPPR